MGGWGRGKGVGVIGEDCNGLIPRERRREKERGGWIKCGAGRGRGWCADHTRSDQTYDGLSVWVGIG